MVHFELCTTSHGNECLKANNSLIVGDGNTVVGDKNIVIGRGNKVVGNGNHVVGEDMHCEGRNNKTRGFAGRAKIPKNVTVRMVDGPGYSMQNSFGSTVTTTVRVPKACKTRKSKAKTAETNAKKSKTNVKKSTDTNPWSFDGVLFTG